ncbi:hypothetical protein PHYBOEH_005864 [Phytophthora boehmeriae]|uniref:RxLR effector protein n=1 Tax=Phytophthora boehmeriae TaxID=109152 RepID=A0A8T1WLK9_9STRA|nr:hypothetical protein PHYBOEH_005864 [Phytophthora boehmeriae]
MRVSCFLFAAAAVILTSLDAASAANDVDRSLSVTHGVSRLLRTREVTKDASDDSEDNSGDEERMGLSELVKNAPLKSLDDAADELSKVAGAAKLIKPLQEENKLLFLKIANNKVTPDSMAKTLGIAEKQAVMTAKELKRDPSYLLWKKYSKFWNERRAQE